MFNTIVSWILTNIFGNTGMFMGLLVFIGLLIVGKPWYDSVAGWIKATVGFMIYSVASSGMTTAFRPILFAMKSIINREVLILDGYYGMSVMQEAVASVGRAMTIYTIGMVITLFAIILMVYLKKITKLRCVNIAANTMNANAMTACCFLILAWPEIPDIWLLLGVFAFALLGTAFSNMIIEDVQEFTDGAGFTVFHSQTLMIWLGSRIGNKMVQKSEKTGKPIKKWDNLKLPNWLSIFDDITVSSTLVMLVVFGVMMLIVGKENIMEYDTTLSANKSFAIYIFQTACNFGVYMVILTTGIRMFVAELSVAFNAISDKLLKGGLPALDIACTYGFMKNPAALSMSFLFGTIVTELFTFACVMLNLPFVAIMGFTSMFFENGSAGMFAHEKGGIKLQVIINIITAAIQVFVAGAIVYALGFGQFGGCGLTSNFALIFAWAVPAVRSFGKWGIILMLVVGLALPQIQYLLTKDTYWLAVEDWEEYKRVKAEKAAKKACGAKK